MIICKICNAELRDKEHIVRHMKAIHNIDSAAICNICHKKFKDGDTRKLADGSSVKVDEDYLLKWILSPGDQIAASDSDKAYPRSMPPGLGRQLGDRKRLALVEFIKRLPELIEDGKLISVKRSEIVEEATKPQ